ncbi:hypothetical protein Q7C_1228 [Methylophaga frappieri]|uniref:histidine kinase n=2 Tax=Methylophaga frappieri (strain ATCC BAA-2434 / DSM 25690 / JAM7) TaxID=754477 RepID=I1YHI5_METFJ|nr:hypothetical protein Q7C_1228 [Methylophaga frappieri]
MGRLFWKFFFAFLLALLIAGLGVGTTMWLHQEQINQRLTDAPIQIGKLASIIVSDAADIGQYGGAQGLRQYLTDQQQNGVARVYAFDDNDQELLGRDLEDGQLDAVRQLYDKVPHLRSIRLLTPESDGSLLLFIPANVVAPLNDYPPHGPKPPKPLITLMIAGIFSGLFFSAFLAWWFTKPIRHLRGAFQAVAKGQLATRIGPAMGRRKDELAELGRHFDDMTAKLENLVSAQRNLLHDVSHELRSPLARVQAAIGLAEQRPEKTPEVMARLEKESERMDYLIGDLLNLSRLDSLAADKAEQALFELSPLLDELLDDARYEANLSQITITANILAPLWLYGKPVLILRALENVLRNAIKFTPENGAVLFQAEAIEKHVIIHIQDSGPGVKADELQHLFTPFFKGEQGREHQTSTGLGLTIAERAVKAHRGEIIAKHVDKGGLHIEIRLPNAKRPD